MFSDFPDLPLEKIGDRLRLVRKKLGLSQGEMALRVGVDQGALSRVERGERPPSAKLLAGIARYFPEEDLGVLLTGTKRPDAPDVATNKGTVACVVDTKMLSQILSGIDSGLDELGLTLKAPKKAELAGLLYDHFYNKRETDKDTILRFLKLAS